MYGKLINNDLKIYEETALHETDLSMMMKGYYPVIETEKPKIGYVSSYAKQNKKIVQVWQYSKEQHITDLKQQLSDTDYAIIKIAEGAATAEEYVDVIVQRQEWRAKINELQEQ